MKHYKKILVAIDLEGAADQVLSKVATLTNDSATKVIALNVAYYPMVSYPAMYGADMAIPEDGAIETEKLRIRALTKIKGRLLGTISP